MSHFKFARLLLALLLTFPIVSSMYGQSPPEVLYTGKESQIPLSDFLLKVEKQYPVKFYFKPEWLVNYKVDVNATNRPLREVLDRLLYDKPYAYKQIQGNSYVLLPKDKLAILYGQMVDKSGSYGDFTTIMVGNPTDAGKSKIVTVKGKIRDGKNEEPLIGAILQIENTRINAASDNMGNYSFSIAPGIYTITASNMGYELGTYKVKIVSNGELMLDLYEKSLKIDEIVILAQRADRNVRNSQMSIVEMDSRAIKRLPSLVGEKDVLKSFTMMPGVKSVGEFGSGINVRGGGDDQNLYLIEDAPIFNTSHVFGLMSVLNPDAVSNVTLYKGHIPASFGERASSVMDIQIRDNAPKELHARGGIGVFDSRLLFDGPIIKDKLSFKLGGRIGYPNWLLKKTKDYYLEHSDADFYDMNALLNWNYGKNRFTAFYYDSYDKFKYASELAYEYKSKLGSLTWNRFWTSSLSSSMVLSYSLYNVRKDDLLDTTRQSRLNLQTQYAGAKFSTKYTAFTGHELEAGAQVINYESNPGEKTPLGLNLYNVVSTKLNTQKAYESALFISDNYELNSKITLNVGLRYSLYALMGPYKKYVYNSATGVVGLAADSVQYASGKIAQQYSGLEPRISVKYQLLPEMSIKASYNRNYQYLQLLSNTSIATPNDIWKLSDAFIKPLRSDQYVLGVYRNFLGNTMETSVEFYYKDLQNMQEFRNDAVVEMNSHVETALVNAKGQNYGVEFMIKKNAGKIDGWISYTYSHAYRQTSGRFDFDQINKNKRFPSSYDKPNDLTIIGNYHFNKRIVLSTNFSYSSGRPVTQPENSVSLADGNQYVLFSDRNKYRLPDYHRLDISLSIDESLRIKKKWKGSWTFAILNVYGRRNPYSVFYKKATPSINNNYRAFSMYDMYLIGSPMPVITYNFLF